MNLTEIKLPKTLICPACSAPITNASATRSAPGQTFQKGVILICSSCTSVCQVGDSSLVLMTPDQVNKLSPQSKAALLATRKILQTILEKRNPRIVDLN